MPLANLPCRQNCNTINASLHFSLPSAHLLKSPLADVQMVHVTTAPTLVAVVVAGVVAATAGKRKHRTSALLWLQQQGKESTEHQPYSGCSSREKKAQNISLTLVPAAGQPKHATSALLWLHAGDNIYSVPTCCTCGAYGTFCYSIACMYS